MEIEDVTADLLIRGMAEQHLLIAEERDGFDLAEVVLCSLIGALGITISETERSRLISEAAQQWSGRSPKLS